MSGKSKKKARPGKAAVRESFDQAAGDILLTSNTPSAMAAVSFGAGKSRSA